jgi:ABC-type Fe3+ transport system permease subunit
MNLVALLPLRLCTSDIILLYRRRTSKPKRRRAASCRQRSAGRQPQRRWRHWAMLTALPGCGGSQTTSTGC